MTSILIILFVETVLGVLFSAFALFLKWNNIDPSLFCTGSIITMVVAAIAIVLKSESQ